MANDIRIIPEIATMQFSGSAKNRLSMQVLPSGSVEFFGPSGSIFQLDEELTGSLMSVNDISGLPILEVFSDNKVVMGAYNQNGLVVSGSSVGIGTSNIQTKLHVWGTISASAVTATSSFANSSSYSFSSSYAIRSSNCNTASLASSAVITDSLKSNYTYMSANPPNTTGYRRIGSSTIAISPTVPASFYVGDENLLYVGATAWVQVYIFGDWSGGSGDPCNYYAEFMLAKTTNGVGPHPGIIVREINMHSGNKKICAEIVDTGPAEPASFQINFKAYGTDAFSFTGAIAYDYIFNQGILP